MPSDTDLPDDQEDTTLDGDDETGDSGEQQGPTLEQLQTELATLKATNTKSQRELIAAVGRLQALQAKVDAGTGDSETVTALQTQMAAANEVLDALLEDEAIDPKVKERAGRARTKAQSDSELATLRREIEALKNDRKAPAPAANDNAPSPFEVGVVTAIQTAGLDPDDTSLFDWQEATQLFHTKGAAAATDYFKTKIAEGLASKSAAGRRQTKKDAGSTQVNKAGGPATNPLDPERPAEERLKYLMAQGHI